MALQKGKLNDLQVHGEKNYNFDDLNFYDEGTKRQQDFTWYLFAQFI